MFLPMSLATTSTVLVVALTLLLIASLKKQTLAYKFFTNPRVIYIGLISYSLYLWHWGVLSISRWTIGIHWWSIPFQIAVMLGLAIISYRYIETPFRKGNWFGKRWKTIVGGVGVILTLASSIIVLGKFLKSQLFLGKRIEPTKIILLKGEQCIKNISEQTECYLIDNNKKQTLWLLGDSHAQSLSLAGEQVANSLGMNLKLFTAGGTTFPPVEKYRKSLKSNKKKELQMVQDFRFVQKELYRQIQFGDVIFLSIRMPFHFGGTYFGHPADYQFFKKDGSFLSQENYFNEWIASVVNLANMVKDKGANVIIQTPTPEWEKEYINPRCSISKTQWFNVMQRTNCQIKSKFFIDKEQGIYKHLLKKLNQISSSHENINLFDTYKVVCPESNCRFSKNGIDIYRDENHISNKWARDFLAPKIFKFINSSKTMNR